MKHRLLVFGDATTVHTSRWIEGLSQSGQFEIHLMTMNPKSAHPEMKNHGIAKQYQVDPGNIDSNGGNFGYLRKVPQIRRLVREIKPDLISTLYLTSYGFVGALVRGSTKMVHYTLGSDIMITPDRSFAHKCLTKFALNRSDFVISASQSMTRKLVDHLGYPETRILTQQYGVTDRVIEYPKQQRTYDVVSNRQWVPNSNIDYVLEILAGSGPLRSILVGHSEPGNEALGEKLTHLGKQLPNCEMHSQLPYDQNINLVAKSRFLASLTNSDGASLSVMEGMALGTVPLLSDIPANREWVKHGVNGFLIPLDDLEGARKIMREALALNEEAREAMAVKCKHVIYEKGSLTRNMKRVSDIMLNLIEGAK